ncbi:MAG: DUF5362 domain-containing protein [Prevotellaceae bacterium]|jgi:hypothetical protein|nr:DUF5362 domain-containing protein [Prevotellaceae bacterium]
MENQINNTGQILSESSIESIRKTAPWMKFLSILSFIGGGLLLIFGLRAIVGAIVAVINYSSVYGMYYGGDTTFLIIGAILCMVLAIVIICIGSYLYKSANAYSEYCRTNNNDSLETAFLQQRKYWKISGIVTIVILSLFLIALIMFVSAVSSSRW